MLTLPLMPICSFNSRTREGCDMKIDYLQDLKVTFQFTHPGGVRLATPLNRSHTTMFQFTHPGGVRLVTFVTTGDPDRFNSRTREGCDSLTVA